MEDIPESSSIEQEYKANVDLSYDYYEKSIKELQSRSKDINTEFGLLISFNLTFIRFFIFELPNRIYNLDFLPCNSCLILKILAYISAFISIICCLLGLYIRTSYFIIPQHLLIDNCEEVPSLDFKLAILKTWKDKLESFLASTRKKKVLLNYSLFLFLFSGLIAAIDSILVSIFY